MSTATLPTPSTLPFAPAAASPPPCEEPFGGLAWIHRLTVEEYHEMIRAGVLGEEDPVELLEGYLVTKMARSPKHDHAIRVLTYLLIQMLPSGWAVSPQTAATLSDSEPEPDFTIARGSHKGFPDRHPGRKDIVLAIEVSDSSLTRDTRDKVRIYARAGVPVYWVLNIPDRRIEVFTDPSGPTDSPVYKTRVEYPVGAEAPVVLDGNTVGTIAVADVIV